MGNYYYRSSGELKWPNVFATVLGLFGLVAVIVFGGYEMGWWLRADATNREAQVYQHSDGRQNAQTANLSQSITTVDTITAEIGTADPEQAAALRAQRRSVAVQACAAAAALDTIPPAYTAWVAANCANGTVAASSTYAAGA